MRYYIAPLEGITGYIFRNAHTRLFTPADKYFSPFLVPKPNSRKQFSAKEKADILPEHNQNIHLVPQIMTNKAADFIAMTKALEEYGYQEVNLNLGCPSRTVVTKGRGAGFLSDPETLQFFFDEVFREIKIKISVKTRIGLEHAEEFQDLLSVYNQFPFEELIIHPRVQCMYYNGTPDMETFAYACQNSKNSLCYNGDLFRKADFERFREQYPKIPAVMFGRGVLANPELIGEIKGKNAMDKRRFRVFHDSIFEAYREAFQDDKNAMFKMKEFWYYAADMFTASSKYAKKIKKTKSVSTYEETVAQLFDEQELIAGAGFSKKTE